MPVLVKIAPDLSSEDIEDVARMVVDEGLAGVNDARHAAQPNEAAPGASRVRGLRAIVTKRLQ